MKATLSAVVIGILIPFAAVADNKAAFQNKVRAAPEDGQENQRNSEGMDGFRFVANETGQIFVADSPISDKQFSAICKELARFAPDNSIHFLGPRTISAKRHWEIVRLSFEAGIKEVVSHPLPKNEPQKTEQAAADQLALADINEAQYRSKYAFSVDYSPPHVESHPDGIHSVRAKFSIRECDTEDGEVVLLAFYKDSTLLKSYTLKELWPKPEDRRFHTASGVFVWVAWHPTINTFRENIFSIYTIDGLLRFDMTTGARIESRAKKVESRKP